jgi:protoporphyrin/coproporphyrin ferrochelatase
VKLAVVLFNLGGPDGPRAVRPFLKNLFSDPAIIRAPGWLRWILAELISRLREPLAVKNYAVMGGASPLNAETQAQADALAAELGRRRPADEMRVFTAMRYWRPLTEAAAAEVAAYAPDELVLLPLYPQYSTTTTASSLAEWTARYAGGGRQRTVCCYFDAPGLVEAHADLIRAAWATAGSPKPVRLLFSAHGLPQSISDAGDPYRWQVEQTCAQVAARLGKDWDWRLCFQSRVGPMKWIGPETLAEIEAAGAEGLGVIVDPIAFVSEHVETLVELDRDYAAAAERAGAQPYIRVPAQGTHPRFIGALADLVEGALSTPDDVRPGGASCPADASACALAEGRRAA